MFDLLKRNAAVAKPGDLLRPAFFGLLLTAAIYFIRCLVTNLLLSPLRHHHGPLIAKLTPKWMFLVDMAFKRATYIHSLHQRYGPVVRIGPNELSFATAAATHDIYVGVPYSSGDKDRKISATSSPQSATHSASAPSAATPGALKTFPKSSFYAAAGRESLFNIMDEARHRARVKRIGHCYAPSVLRDTEPLMRHEVATLLAALERRRGTELNMLYWFRMMAFDVIGQLFLGQSFNSVKSGEPPAFTRYFDTMNFSWALDHYFPRTYNALYYVPSKKLRHFLDSGRKVFEEGAAAVDSFVARYGRNVANAPAGLPIAKLLAGNPAKGLAPLPDAAIANELALALIAGSDTLGTTLAYIFFELAHHPEWLARLRAELKDVQFDEPVRVHLGLRSHPHSLTSSSLAAAPAVSVPDAHGGANADKGSSRQHERSEAEEGNDGEEEEFAYRFPSLRALANLPVLNAIINETLRLYPIVPARLPRVAPAGGALVDGVWVPEGTDVSVQPFTLQRTASVFPEPEKWDPARWFIRTSLVSGSSGSGGGGDGSSTAPDDSTARHDVGHAVDGGSDKGRGDEAGNSTMMTATGTAKAVTGAALCADGTESMRAHMLPFSKGLRTCIGRGIALAEMRLALAVIAQRFGSVRMRDARQVEADMSITDFSLLIPRGHRCMLVFE